MCFAESLPADAWIQSFLKLEADLQLNLWFGRVPTSSNIADGPSRLTFQDVASLGGVRSRPGFASLHF